MTDGGGDRRIPLLREIYEQFPETPINIDIKVNNDDLIRKVCQYVAHNKLILSLYLLSDLPVSSNKHVLLTLHV